MSKKAKEKYKAIKIYGPFWKNKNSSKEGIRKQPLLGGETVGPEEGVSGWAGSAFLTEELS